MTGRLEELKKILQGTEVEEMKKKIGELCCMEKENTDSLEKRKIRFDIINLLSNLIPDNTTTIIGSEENHLLVNAIIQLEEAKKKEGLTPNKWYTQTVKPTRTIITLVEKTVLDEETVEAIQTIFRTKAGVEKIVVTIAASKKCAQKLQIEGIKTIALFRIRETITEISSSELRENREKMFKQVKKALRGKTPAIIHKNLMKYHPINVGEEKDPSHQKTKAWITFLILWLLSEKLPPDTIALTGEKEETRSIINNIVIIEGEKPEENRNKWFENIVQTDKRIRETGTIVFITAALDSTSELESIKDAFQDIKKNIKNVKKINYLIVSIVKDIENIENVENVENVALYELPELLAIEN